MAIGPLELIVHDVNVDGEVTAVGLAIDQDSQRSRVPVFVNGRELIDLVKRRFGKRRRRKGPDGPTMPARGDEVPYENPPRDEGGDQSSADASRPT